MAKEQAVQKPREIAVVNLYESQNIVGLSNKKTLVAKDEPGMKLFEGESNSVIVEINGKTSKICHIKSIVYK